jgi:RNA polymerase-binding transcription factor DksA
MVTQSLQRRKQLEEEIEWVQEQVKSITGLLHREGSWGNDQADQASDLVERAKALAFYQDLMGKRRQLEQARTRFDLGLDGACELCGKPIDAERLRIMVGTTRCTKCQQQMEQRLSRY